ncbi:MAG: flagellar export protein FliJ [Candidatus Eremiobacteraeota bacterium]|nr:flagellar export protein FliJ [Candidatus Eremiobacteraeota bacterium]
MSRRFRFALDPVLEHRKRIEDQRRQELALAQLALNAATAELLRLLEEFRKNSNILREDHKTFDVEQLRLHYAHLEFLDRAITAQEAVVAQRKAEHAQTRLRLLEASKEKKALDKLKTRRQEAHVAAEAIVDQRELDDSNARRYSRLTAGGKIE